MNFAQNLELCDLRLRYVEEYGARTFSNFLVFKYCNTKTSLHWKSLISGIDRLTQQVQTKLDGLSWFFRPHLEINYGILC